MSKIRKIRDAHKANYQLPAGSLAEALVHPVAKPQSLFDAVVANVQQQPKRISLMDQLISGASGESGNAAQAALDMIANAPEPPPPTKSAVPHVITFAGIANTLGKVYRNPDEARRHSKENARHMRNDLLVMECLEARQRATALLPWHIEPENPKDEGENEAAAILTSICERIPRFTEYRRNLLEATWSGRQGMQNIFGEKTIKRQKWYTVCDYVPINGDKLAFKWNGRVGIQVGFFGMSIGYEDEEGNPSKVERNYIKVGDRQAKIEMAGDYGRCYFLTEEERERTVIHKHMIEDGDYLDPISAGSIHGVGIRSRIYWTWFQKQSVLALLMEYLERSALGFDIWTFPWGNPQAEADMRTAAEQRVSGNRNIVLVPVMPGQEGMFTYKHEQPGLEGARLVNEIVHQFFQWQIKRYILGQILSTEPEGGGLGSSGLSDLHKDSLMSVVNYDARNLEETITEQLLTQLVKLNRHKLPESARNSRFKFVIDSESADIKESLDALKQAWEMNLPITEKSLYKVTGIAAPDVDDKVLQGPSGKGQEMPGVPGEQAAGGAANLAEHLGAQLQDKEPEAPPPANLLEQLAAQYAKPKEPEAAEPVEVAPVAEPPEIPKPLRYAHDRLCAALPESKAQYAREAIQHVPTESPDAFGALAHATAHSLDEGHSNSPEWQDAWREEIQAGDLSRYAATSPVEGFAEFGRLAWSEQAKYAAEQFPMSWAFWQGAGLVRKHQEPVAAPVVQQDAGAIDRVIDLVAKLNAKPAEPDKQKPTSERVQKLARAEQIVRGELARYAAPRSEEEKRARFVDAAKVVAAAIGCRVDEALDNYIDPQIWDETKVLS